MQREKVDSTRVELVLQLLFVLALTIGFGVVAFFSLRVAADRQRAAALSSTVASVLRAGPAWLPGNEWAYSGTGLRWLSLGVGLASLNFVLIAFHLTPLAFISFGCFFVSMLVASVVGFNYVLQQKGIVRALFREARVWEFLAWVLIILYTIGVLLLAKLTLHY